MKPKVIFTAHDFGLCSSVNKGIEYCIKQDNSIISELSLLPNAPGSAEAAQMAKNEEISVSLNVNLTTFSPISKEVPSLIDVNGRFKKVNTKVWDFSSIDSFTEEDVRKELGAQWDWFVENVGRKPTAMLARKNEHGDPRILIPFVEKAKKEGIPIRTPSWKWLTNYGAQSYVKQEGVKQADFTEIGVKDWFGEGGFDLVEDFDKLLELLKSRGGITEILLFIGFVDKELFDISIVNWQRGQFVSLVVNKHSILSKLEKTFDIISYEEL